MLAKARKSSFNANIGEFCSITFVCLFVFFYGALNYLDIFRIQANAIIKCVKRETFWCTRRTRNVLSTFDFRLVILTNKVS